MKERMDVLPGSWECISVGEAVDSISTIGKKIPQKLYLKSGTYPVIDQGRPYIGGYTNDESKLLDCPLPVIVFGDHTRTVKYVNQPFAPGADGVKVLRPHPFFVPKLFEYFIRYISVALINKGYARHYQHLAKSLIRIPPINEQRRIVGRIDEIFSELDEGINIFKTAREQLKVYREALLKLAFEGTLTANWRDDNKNRIETSEGLLTRIKAERSGHYQTQLRAWQRAVSEWEAQGKLGRRPSRPTSPKPLSKLNPGDLTHLPDGWVWEKLGWMTCSVEYGTSAKSSGAGSHPVIRMGNIQNGKLDWHDLAYSSDSEEIDKYSLQEGDVLFNRTNSPELVGKAAIYRGERPALFAGYLIRINQIESIVDAQYLNLFLNSPVAKQYANTVKTDGVNQSNINGQKLINYPFPFCSKAEQQAVARKLETLLSGVEAAEEEIRRNLLRAETLRQSILKKAFSGKLVSQNSNDEPASALLERIKTAKDAQGKVTPSGKTKKKAKSLTKRVSA